MSIRPPEYVELRALDPQLVRTHYTALVTITEDLPPDGWTAEKFFMELPNKWQLSFSGWYREQAIAYAVLSRKTPSTVHLHRFMIAKAWRGVGLGHDLLGEILRRTSAAGAHYCSLKVAQNNEAAQRFYLRHGFEQTGRVREYIEMHRTVRNEAPSSGYQLTQK
jgi:ribosomal protein S18 acetylase RimI-like enzyme